MTADNRASQRTLRLMLLTFLVLLGLFVFTTAASLLLAGPDGGRFGSCSATSSRRGLLDALPRQVTERYARWIYLAGDIHDFPPTRICRLYAWEGPYPNINGGSIVTTTSNKEEIPSYYKPLAEKSTPSPRWYEIWIILLISIPLAVFLFLRTRAQPASL